MHQHRYGIIYHRFVVDGKQLFAYPFSYGIETCAAPPCQDYAFHTVSVNDRMESPFRSITKVMIFVVKSSVNTGPFLPNPTSDRFHGIKVYDAKEPDENIR